MKYKAIIFDMDGLILDTEMIEHRSLEKMLREYGAEPIPNENGLIHKVGVGGSFYENFKEKYQLKESIENIRDKKRAYWVEIVKTEGVAPFPGFVELLQLLKQEGYVIALASNRNEKSVHLILDILNVKDYFSFIFGAADKNIRQKPFPDIYINAAKELGLNPSDCIVLEDSASGVISGKNAGMKVIAVPNIYTKGHDFSKADIMVESLSDVNISLIESL